MKSIAAYLNANGGRVSRPALRRLLRIDKIARLPLIRPVATINDPARNSAYELIAFKMAAGKYCLITVPRDVALEPRALAKLLDNRAADLPRNVARRLKVVAKAIEKKPIYQLECAARFGWTSDFKAFAMRHRVVGKSSNTQLCPPPMPDKPAYVTKSAGDLASWNKSIGEVAGYSSVMALSICAAFAAPLLSLIHRPSFGIMIAGDSKVGKTTGVLAGASLVGIPDEEELIKWDLSGARLRELLVLCCDQLAVIDETKLIEASNDKERYLKLRQYVYQIASGRVKSVSGKSEHAMPVGQAAFRTIVLTSSEDTLEQMATKAGAQLGGDAARLYSVSARPSGHSRIFDRFPPDAPKGKRRKWAREKAKSMRGIYPKHLGVPFEAFIERLVAIESSKRVSMIRSAMAEFVSATAAMDLQAKSEHCRDNFAVLYAGGALAIDLGIWRFGKKRLMRAIRICLDSALQGVDGQNIEAEAIAQLERGIASARWLDASDVPPDVRPQFVRQRREADGRTAMFVEPKAFEAWFSSPGHMQAAARRLALEGRIVLERGVNLVQRSAFGRDLISTRPRLGEQQHRFVQLFELARKPAS